MGLVIIRRPTVFFYTNTASLTHKASRKAVTEISMPSTSCTAKAKSEKLQITTSAVIFLPKPASCISTLYRTLLAFISRSLV